MGVLADIRALAAHLDPVLAGWLSRCDEADILLAHPSATQALAFVGKLPNVQLF
jgi:hypothetical protein